MTTTTSIPATLTRMVIADGMQSNENWGAMGEQARRDWLASLEPVLIRAQASIRAVAARRTVAEIITAWVLCGYLSSEDAAAALAAEIAP